MITSFLYSAALSLSGTGIAYEDGPVGSATLYNPINIALSNDYTVVTVDSTYIIRIDNSYDGQQIGLINQDRSSLLFTFASAGDGTETVSSTANWYDNVGPRQRALVQGYEA